MILSLGHGRGDGGEELAARPGEAWCAGAGRWGLARPTSSVATTPVEARAKGALIQDSVAISSAVAHRTNAGVVVYSVLTGATVEAGVTGTLIDVDFAALAGKSCTAATHPHATVEQTESTYRRGERDGWCQKTQLTLAAKMAAT